MKELNSLEQIRGPDPNYNDICFSTAGRYTSLNGSDNLNAFSSENQIIRNCIEATNAKSTFSNFYLLKYANKLCVRSNH